MATFQATGSHQVIGLSCDGCGMTWFHDPIFRSSCCPKCGLVNSIRKLPFKTIEIKFAKNEVRGHVRES